ncbi:MAG TPA: RNase A-like domain-containing protein [Jatrophihabitans sp.]|jgi:uncharacterized protein YukE|uniref:RNase A-like domain-containing protein n=1 Tax=Jatrophihabitans sp. TaxID=1932789 RepID=UPI002F10B933
MAISRFELPGEGLLAAQVCLDQRMPAGDPVGLHSAAARSGAWAAELRRVASVLLSNADTPLWTGPAHRAFVEQVRANAPCMSATAERYERYASALHAYAGALDETAPRLLAARSQLRQRYDELIRQPTDPEQAPASFWATALPVRPVADTAGLLLIARDFKAGYDRWADALDRCVRALFEADEADPTRDKHGFSALGRSLAAVAKRHLSPYQRALAHPSLANISDCLGTLNIDLTVLGVGLLFICPPAGMACLAAATVLALTQVAVDATRRAQGEQVSNTHLGLQLAAAVPIGGSAVRGLRAAGNVTHLVPGGGLMAHEGLEGGHTLAKHVGKTEDYLRHRLATEPQLKAASTFYDREIAENTIARVLDAHGPRVNRWLEGTGKTHRLVGSMPQHVGVVITRTSTGPVDASVVKLVLRRSSAMPTGFRIHTAMVIE